MKEDIGWFAVKGIAYLALIGFTVWFMHSAWALWALCLMPSFTDKDDKDQ